MADIIIFPGRKPPDSAELARLRAKLIELHECKEAILREIRLTRDLIKMYESGENK
jgi:hypothetical protein